MRGQLSHIEINVTDLRKSEEFWGWLLTRLGYTPYESWEDGRSWKLGETYFVIVQVEDAFRLQAYHRKRTGLNHLAFHVDDRAEVDKFTEEFKARNIPVLYADRHPYAAGKGTYAVFFEDPNRIKVELVATGGKS
jgi:catechol 2,3-dioxygenase-like lactoylglutathione lyase family enzyme